MFRVRKKRRARRSTFDRFVSGVVSLCFLLQGLPLSPVYSAAFQPEIRSDIFEKPSFSIPSALGSVDEFHVPPSQNSKSRPLLIHIQTAHGSYEAQVKIKELLSYLTEEYAVRDLLIEGSSASLDPKLDQFFSDNDWNRKILENLAERGYASGVGLFLTEKSGRGIRTFGIESAEAYRKNRETFKAVLGRHDLVRSFLLELKQSIDGIASRHLNKELFAFIQRREAFQDKKISVELWIRQLFEDSRKVLDVDLTDRVHQSDWPAMVRMLRLTAAEKKLDADALKAEKEKFLLGTDRMLSHEAKTILSRLMGDESVWSERGGISQSYGSVRAELERIVAELPYDFDFDRYPNLKLWFQVLAFKNEIRPQGLFDEAGRLNDLIAAKLVRSGKENEIVELLRDYEFLSKLLMLELMPDEYRKIKTAGAGVSPDRMVDRMEAYRFGACSSCRNSLRDIMRLFRQARHFYGGAGTRERAMRNKIRAVSEKGDRKAYVLISGGYHAPGLMQKFAQDGFGYALVTPRISDAGSRENYLNSFLETAVTLFPKSTIEDAAALPIPYRDLGSLGVSRDFASRIRLDAIYRFLASGPGLDHFPQVNKSRFARSAGIRIKMISLQPKLSFRSEVRAAINGRVNGHGYYSPQVLRKLQRDDWAQILDGYRQSAAETLSHLDPEDQTVNWRQIFPAIFEQILNRIPSNFDRDQPTVLAIVGTSGVAKTAIAREIHKGLSEHPDLSEMGLTRAILISGDDVRLETPPEDLKTTDGRPLKTRVSLLSREYARQMKAYEQTVDGPGIAAKVKLEELHAVIREFYEINEWLKYSGFQPYDIETGELSRDLISQFEFRKLAEFWEALRGEEGQNIKSEFRRHLPVFDTTSRGRLRFRVNERGRPEIVFRVRDNLRAEIKDQYPTGKRRQREAVWTVREGDETIEDEKEIHRRTRFFANNLQVRAVKRRIRFLPGGKKQHSGYEVKVRGSRHHIFPVSERVPDTREYETVLYIFYEGVKKPVRIRQGEMADVLVRHDVTRRTLVIFEWMLALELNAQYYDAVLTLDADPWIRLLRQDTRFVPRKQGILHAQFIRHRQEAWLEEDGLIRHSMANASDLLVEMHQKVLTDVMKVLTPGKVEKLEKKHDYTAVIPVNTERRHERIFRLTASGKLTAEPVAQALMDRFYFQPADLGFEGRQDDFSPAALLQRRFLKIVESVILEKLDRSGGEIVEDSDSSKSEDVLEAVFEDFIIKFRHLPGSDILELTPEDLKQLDFIKRKGGGNFDPFIVMDFAELTGNKKVIFVKKDGGREEKVLGKVLVQTKGVWKSLKNRLDYLAQVMRKAEISGQDETVRRVRRETESLLGEFIRNFLHLSSSGIFLNQSLDLAAKEISPEGLPLQSGFLGSLRHGNAVRLEDLQSLSFLDILTDLPAIFHEVYLNLLRTDFGYLVDEHGKLRNPEEFHGDFTAPISASFAPSEVPSIVNWGIARRWSLDLNKLIIKSKIRDLQTRVLFDEKNPDQTQGWGRVIRWAYLFKEGILYPDSTARDVLEYIYEDLQDGPDLFLNQVTFDSYRRLIYEKFPALKDEESVDRRAVDYFFETLPQTFKADAVILDYHNVLYRSPNHLREIFYKAFGEGRAYPEFIKIYREIMGAPDILDIRRRAMTGDVEFEQYLSEVNRMFRDATGISSGAVSEDDYMESITGGEDVNPGAAELVQRLKRDGIPYLVLTDQYAGTKAAERVMKNLNLNFPGLFKDNQVLFSFSPDVNARKEEGEKAFREALKRLNIPPDQAHRVLLMDDRAPNTNAAEEAGLQGFVYDYRSAGLLDHSVIVLPYDSDISKPRSEVRDDSDEPDAGHSAVHPAEQFLSDAEYLYRYNVSLWLQQRPARKPNLISPFDEAIRQAQSQGDPEGAEALSRLKTANGKAHYANLVIHEETGKGILIFGWPRLGKSSLTAAFHGREGWKAGAEDVSQLYYLNGKVFAGPDPASSERFDSIAVNNPENRSSYGGWQNEAGDYRPVIGKDGQTIPLSVRFVEVAQVIYLSSSVTSLSKTSSREDALDIINRGTLNWPMEYQVSEQLAKLVPITAVALDDRSKNYPAVYETAASKILDMLRKNEEIRVIHAGEQSRSEVHPDEPTADSRQLKAESSGWRSEVRTLSKGTFDWDMTRVQFPFTKPHVRFSKDQRALDLMSQEYLRIQEEAARGTWTPVPILSEDITLKFGGDDGVQLNFGPKLFEKVGSSSTRTLMSGDIEYRSLVDLSDPSNVIILGYSRARSLANSSRPGLLYVFRGSKGDAGWGMYLIRRKNQAIYSPRELLSHPVVSLFTRKVLRNFYDQPQNRMKWIRTTIERGDISQPETGSLEYGPEGFSLAFPDLRNHVWDGLEWRRVGHSRHRPTAFVLDPNFQGSVHLPEHLKLKEPYVLIVPMSRWTAVYTEKGLIREYPYGSRVGLHDDPGAQGFFQKGLARIPREKRSEVRAYEKPVRRENPVTQKTVVTVNGKSFEMKFRIIRDSAIVEEPLDEWLGIYLEEYLKTHKGDLRQMLEAGNELEFVIPQLVIHMSAKDPENPGSIRFRILEANYPKPIPAMPVLAVGLIRSASRSEVRDDNRLMGSGPAVLALDHPSLNKARLQTEELESLLSVIRRTLTEKRNAGVRDLATGMAEHLSKVPIYVFDEQRWAEDKEIVSFLLATAAAKRIEIGRGLFVDPDFGAQMLFRVAVESFRQENASTYLKHKKDYDGLADKIFGSPDQFWDVHQAFVRLTRKDFLRSAVDRFQFFRPDGPYFITSNLLSEWIDYDSSIPVDEFRMGHPVIEQAGYLTRMLWPELMKAPDHEFHIQAVMDIVYPYLTFIFHRDQFLLQMSMIIEREITEIKRISEEVYRALEWAAALPNRKTGNEDLEYPPGIDPETGARAIAEMAIIRRSRGNRFNFKEEFNRDDMQRKTLAAFIEGVEAGNSPYTEKPVFAIQATNPEPPSVKSFQTILDINQELVNRALRKWKWMTRVFQEHRVQGQDAAPVFAEGYIMDSEFIPVSDLFEFFRRYAARVKDGWITHVNNVDKTYAWGGISRFVPDLQTDEEYEQSKVRVIHTNGTPSGFLAVRHPMPYYHLDTEERLTISVDRGSIWIDLLKWLQTDDFKDDFEHVREIHLVWPVLLGIRAQLSQVKMKSSYYQFGHTGFDSWVDDILRIHRKVDVPFWQVMRNFYGEFGTPLAADGRSNAQHFGLYHYSIMKNSKGVFADLAAGLEQIPNSDRLTEESTKKLIDTLLAIYWGGPRRFDRERGIIILMSAVMQHLMLHPDGISVRDLEGFKNFLTRDFLEASPKDVVTSDYIDWKQESQFFQDVNDYEDGVQIIPSEWIITDEDPAWAYVVPADQPSFYSPEKMSAAKLLKPESYPVWRGYDKARVGVWQGRYTDRGVQVPGAAFFLLINKLKAGDLVQVHVKAHDSGKGFVVEVFETAEGKPKGEPVLRLPLNVLKQKFGGKQNGWQKVPDMTDVKVSVIAEKPAADELMTADEPVAETGLADEVVSVEKEGFYSKRAGPDGLLRVFVLGEEYFFHIPSARNQNVLIQSSGDNLYFYDAEGKNFIGYVVFHSEGHKYTTGQKGTEISVLPKLLEAFRHTAPDTAARYWLIYGLGNRLAGLLNSGRRYEKIDVVDVDGEPAVHLDLHSGTVVLSRSASQTIPDLLTDPAFAETLFRQALEKEDPVYRVNHVINLYRDIIRNQNEFDSQVEIPEPLQREHQHLLSLWSEDGRHEYERVYNRMIQLFRRLTVSRKVNEYRVKHAKILGKMGKEEAFYKAIRELFDLYEREPDAEFIFRLKDVSYRSPSGLEWPGKVPRVYLPHEGIGITNPSNFGVNFSGNFELEKRPDNPDTTPYLFIRYQPQNIKDKAYIILFDLETGEKVEDRKIEKDKLRAKLEEARQVLIDDAVKQKTKLNLNLLDSELKEFLQAFKFSNAAALQTAGDHPDEALMKIQTDVLELLRQFLHTVLDSENHSQARNFTVLRLILSEILQGGAETAVKGATEMRNGFRKDPGRLLIWLAEYLNRSSAELFLDESETDEDPEESLNEFTARVLIPEALGKGYFSGLFTSEDFILSLFDHILTVGDYVQRQATEFLNARSEDELAGGILALRLTFLAQYTPLRYSANKVLSPVETYFLEKVLLREEKSRAEISTKELDAMRTYYTPYGGAESVGGSSGLVEYRNSRVLVDAGAVPGTVMTLPNYPKEFDKLPQAVFLTHADLDHVGAAVVLDRDYFKGEVPFYVTSGTYHDLGKSLEIMADRLVTNRYSRIRFTRSDVAAFMKNVRILEPGKWLAVTEEMKVQFHGPVGHDNGAASVIVMTPESGTVLTGDVSVHPQGPIPGWIPIPDPIRSHIDTVYSESTHGMQVRESEAEEEEKLVAQTFQKLFAQQPGRVLLPAPPRGMTRRLLFLVLKELAQQPARKVHNFKIYLDGQSALFTKIFLDHNPEFKAEWQQLLDRHVVMIGSLEERRKAFQESRNRPAVIIASSGNASQGASLHWLRELIDDPRNAIYFSSWMDSDEPVSRLLESVLENPDRHEEMYFNLGASIGIVSVRAEIDAFKLFPHLSGEQVIEDVLEPIGNSLRSVYLGHGNLERRRELKERIKDLHPEWQRSFLSTLFRHKGAIMGIKKAIEERRKYFASIEAEPLISIVSALSTKPEIVPPAAIPSSISDAVEETRPLREAFGPSEAELMISAFGKLAVSKSIVNVAGKLSDDELLAFRNSVDQNEQVEDPASGKKYSVTPAAIERLDKVIADRNLTRSEVRTEYLITAERDREAVVEPGFSILYIRPEAPGDKATLRIQARKAQIYYGTEFEDLIAEAADDHLSTDFWFPPQDSTRVVTVEAGYKFVVGTPLHPDESWIATIRSISELAVTIELSKPSGNVPRKSRGRRSEVRLESVIRRTAEDLLAGIYLPEVLREFPDIFVIQPDRKKAKAEFAQKAEWARQVLGRVQTGDALILDPEFALDRGGLALIHAVFGKTVPAVVIARDAQDEEAVAQINQTLQKRYGTTVSLVGTARSIDEAKHKLARPDKKSLSGADALKPATIRALISTESRFLEEWVLARELQDVPVTVVTEEVFDRIASGMGLNQFVTTLRDQFLSLAKSA